MDSTTKSISMSKSSSNITPYISPPDEPLHTFDQPPSSPIKHIQTPKIEKSLDSSRVLPSPQSPPVSTFELANKFRNWSSEFANGRRILTNPDPILYPERRQSAEYNPLFEDDSLNSARKLQAPPAFLNRHNLDISVSANSPSLVTSVATPPSSVDNHVQSLNSEDVKKAVIDDHYKSRTDDVYKTRIITQWVQPKSKVTKWSSPKTIALPTREEYSLVYDLAMRSTVLRDYKSNPKAYLKRQLAENEEHYVRCKRARPTPGTRVILEAKPVAEPIVAAPMPKVRKAIKKQIDRSGTPEVKHRRTPVKKTKAQFHYNDIPDYSPSLATIPTDKNFRVTWSGQPLSLSEDPEADRLLLHPAELQLASKLRFHCSQYLATKRRVFVGRVNNLIKYPNKQFCKTDAQQVGGVDVNKLSQLWEAYNSIGWFDASHFKARVAEVRNADQVYDPKNTKWVEHNEMFGS